MWACTNTEAQRELSKRENTVNEAAGFSLVDCTQSGDGKFNKAWRLSREQFLSPWIYHWKKNIHDLTVLDSSSSAEDSG